jgi:hypothetical protein
VAASMNPRRRQQLQKLDQCGRDMLASAQAGDWDAVGFSHEQFRQVAQALLEQQPVAEEVPAITAALESALELGRQAMGLCAQARGLKMRELAQASNNRNAMKQYSDNSRQSRL